MTCTRGNKGEGKRENEIVFSKPHWELVKDEHASEKMKTGHNTEVNLAAMIIDYPQSRFRCCTFPMLFVSYNKKKVAVADAPEIAHESRIEYDFPAKIDDLLALPGPCRKVGIRLLVVMNTLARRIVTLATDGCRGGCRWDILHPAYAISWHHRHLLHVMPRGEGT